MGFASGVSYHCMYVSRVCIRVRGSYLVSVCLQVATDRQGSRAPGSLGGSWVAVGSSW